MPPEFMVYTPENVMQSFTEKQGVVWQLPVYCKYFALSPVVIRRDAAKAT